MIVPVRPQEQLLLDTLGELPAGRLLCNTAGRAQFAAEYAGVDARDAGGLLVSRSVPASAEARPYSNHCRRI